MTLPLPNLDNRTYADLVAEMRAFIPTYDPDAQWTDHNPSSPGITLLELFAWLAEMLIYRINRVPDEHLRTFLRLLNGPNWQPGSDLAADIRTSVLALRRHERTVTSADYEELALAASAAVARAHCIAQRNLTASTEMGRTTPQPGHISVIIVPTSSAAFSPNGLQPTLDLLQAVEAYLEPRRMLTTRNHVVGPFYAPVSAQVQVVRRADVRVDDLKASVEQALTRFLDPLTGGPEGKGWPFGRNIYVSELYALLEALSGVDYVPEIQLSSVCLPDAQRCVAAKPILHQDGHLIGLALAAHHLPQLGNVQVII